MGNFIYACFTGASFHWAKGAFTRLDNELALVNPSNDLTRRRNILEGSLTTLEEFHISFGLEMRYSFLAAVPRAVS